MSSECAATLNQDSIYERHDVKNSRYLLCRVRLMPPTLVPYAYGKPYADLDALECRRPRMRSFPCAGSATVPQ
jgi:hypothetical protein